MTKRERKHLITGSLAVVPARLWAVLAVFMIGMAATTWLAPPAHAAKLGLWHTDNVVQLEYAVVTETATEIDGAEFSGWVVIRASLPDSNIDIPVYCDRSTAERCMRADRFDVVAVIRGYLAAVDIDGEGRLVIVANREFKLHRKSR